MSVFLGNSKNFLVSLLPWGNIFACGAVKKFGLFKFLAVGVKPDRLKPVRNDFKSVYFFIEKETVNFTSWIFGINVNPYGYAFEDDRCIWQCFIGNFRCNFALVQLRLTP